MLWKDDGEIGLQHWCFQSMLVPTSCQGRYSTQTWWWFFRHLRHGPRSRNATTTPWHVWSTISEPEIRWVVPPFGNAPERIEIEADPRHSELLIKNLGLQTNGKGVNTIARLMSTQHTVFWCFSHALWMDRARRDVPKSIVSGSLCSLSIRLTGKKNTVCRLLEFLTSPYHSWIDDGMLYIYCTSNVINVLEETVRN